MLLSSKQWLFRIFPLMSLDLLSTKYPTSDGRPSFCLKRVSYGAVMCHFFRVIIRGRFLAHFHCYRTWGLRWEINLWRWGRIQWRTRVCCSKSLLFLPSLKTSSIRSAWKPAIINPLHKKPTTNEMSNHGPISLPSSVRKVTEVTVRNSLYHYFIRNSLFSPGKFGFLRGKSTVSQLLSCCNEWVLENVETPDWCCTHRLR